MCVRGDSGGGGGTGDGDGGGSGGDDSGGDSGVGDCGGSEGRSRRRSHPPALELTRWSSDTFRPSWCPIMVPALPPLCPMLHTLPLATAAAAAYRLVSLGESVKTALMYSFYSTYTLTPGKRV